MFDMFRAFLYKPQLAAQKAQKEENLYTALWIYAAFTTGYLLFFYFKPFDFPDTNAPMPQEHHSLMFWFKVMLWQPPLEAAWIVFLLGLICWFQRGPLPLRLSGAALWCASPFALMAAYAQKDGMSKAWLILGSMIWLGLFYPLLKTWRKAQVMPIVIFMLGINAVGLAILGPMILATAIRSSGLFMAAQAAGGFWILSMSTLGLRHLTGLRLPRAFMAVLLSMFFQIAIAFTLHLLGWVPKDILKALLYA